MSLIGYYGSLINRLEYPLEDYLGSDLGWHLEFYKRYRDFSGTVATLRRISDGATYDLTFSANEINWDDAALLSFVSGAEVEMKRIYNQMPLANQLFASMEAPDGQGATIYEGGAWVTMTGLTNVGLDFNGTDEFYEATISPTILQQNHYQGSIAEYKGSGNTYIQNITDDANNTPWMLLGTNYAYYRNSSQDFNSASFTRVDNTPEMIGYQELTTSRVVSNAGTNMSTDSNTATFVGGGMNKFYWGRLRGIDVLCGNIKSCSSWGYLNPKVTDKLNIEDVIKVEYGF